MKGRPTTPARAWRVLPRSPSRFLSGIAAFWTGSELLVLDRRHRTLLYRPGGARTELTTPPLRPRREAAVAWTGRELVVWRGEAAPDANYLFDRATFARTP